MNGAASAAIGLAILAVACDATRTNVEPAPSAGVVAVKPPMLPGDHLAPGELLEGTQEAYGIKLPQLVKVDEVFSDETAASGPVALHPLVDYLRARVTGGELREGTDSATFEHVTAPGKPQPELQIHLARSRDVMRIVFRDATPPVLPPLPDDTARFKRAGLSPSGRILDPTHLD
jgi:hypothetical protein